MKIILTIAGLAPEFGGPSRSVPALATALGRLGADVELISTVPAEFEGLPLLPPSNLVRAHLLPRSARTIGWWPPANAFAKTIRASAAGRDTVVHDQGLWLPSNHAVAVVARQLGRPRVISPRGMLSSWALRAKGLKKKAAWSLYQRKDFMSAAALHVTSPLEVEDCQRTGYRGTVAVVPNGTDMPPRQTGNEQKTESAGRTALCLSRTHPVKGLSTLLEAWAEVRPPDWRLVLAGIDDSSHARSLRDQIDALGLERNVEMIGLVDSEQKWGLYRSADLFVLPSHSENFGLVVAEALASGVPVLTTRGTPWAELEASRSGWWIETGVVPLTNTLRTALSLPPADLAAMGARGRGLVESKYTWDAAARQMLAFYESIVRDHRNGNRQ